MADLVIRGKTYTNIHTVNFNTTDGAIASFYENAPSSPTVTFIDYSTLESGYFTVTLDDNTVIRYDVTETDDKVTSITFGDKTVNVNWGE